MKKKLLLALIATMLVCMGMALAGCGDSTSNYDSQKIVWSDDTGDLFEATTTGDEIIWDEQKQRDAFCLYLDVKNLQDKEANFKSTSNIYGKRGDKGLSTATVSGIKEGVEHYATCTTLETLAPGETTSIALAYYLDNDEDITITFGSYTSAVKVNEEGTVDLTFSVADRLSDGMKSVVEAQNEGNFSNDSYEVKVLDGWIISSSSDDSISLENESTSAFVSIDTSATDASKNSKRVGDSFKKKVEETTIGSNKWKIVTLSDSHFYLFADSSSGSSIEVHVMASHKDADNQIKKIVIK